MQTRGARSLWARPWFWISLVALAGAVAAIVWFLQTHDLHASPEFIVRKYGYLAVFVGTFLEGETILAIAGFLSSQHYLRIYFVILVAALGAFIGHVFWFWLGRTQGHKIIDRFPKLLHAFDRVIRLLDRHGAGAIFISQYIYGFRITAAVMFGLSHIKTARFILWQAISCLVWATLITGLGFYFGKAVHRVLGQAAEVEKVGLGVIVAIGVGIFVYHKIKDRKKKNGAAVGS